MECPCAVSRFYSRCTATISPANTMDTILVSFMRMLMDGPEVSLNGSPHGIAYDSRLVFLTALSSQLPALYVFFCVIPGSSGICHHNSQHKPSNRIACQQSGYTLRPQKKPPTATGMMTATMAGATISLWAEMVHISTQAP